VDHTCNPSYSGGRDQEDCGLKLALANSSWDSISKNPSQRAGGVAQGVGTKFKPCTAKQTNKQNSKQKKKPQAILSISYDVIPLRI
jgi:hypothetical protein